MDVHLPSGCRIRCGSYSCAVFLFAVLLKLNRASTRLDNRTCLSCLRNLAWIEVKSRLQRFGELLSRGQKPALVGGWTIGHGDSDVGNYAYWNYRPGL